MIDSISSSLQKYFDFKGRATRSEFWTFTAFYFLIVVAGGIVDGFTNSSDIFSSIAQFALFIPLLSCEVRRMHDVGKSGWFILVPIYNFILCVTPTKSTDQG